MKRTGAVKFKSSFSVTHNACLCVQPVPPQDVCKFFGMSPTEGDAIVQNQHFEKNMQLFFNNEENVPRRGPAPQSYDAAAQIFHGVEAPVKGQSQGKPIPGTCTFRPRVEADNIFAQTYGASLECSQLSNERIAVEKSETLRGAQNWMAYD